MEGEVEKVEGGGSKRKGQCQRYRVRACLVLLCISEPTKPGVSHAWLAGDERLTGHQVEPSKKRTKCLKLGQKVRVQNSLPDSVAVVG